MGIGSPCRNLKCSITTIGKGTYSFGLNIISNVYGVITNGLGNESNCSIFGGFCGTEIRSNFP